MASSNPPSFSNIHLPIAEYKELSALLSCSNISNHLSEKLKNCLGLYGRLTGLTVFYFQGHALNRPTSKYLDIDETEHLIQNPD